MKILGLPLLHSIGKGRILWECIWPPSWSRTWTPCPPLLWRCWHWSQSPVVWHAMALLLPTPPGPSQMCSLWVLWGSCKATCHFSCYLDHCRLVASVTTKAFIFISCVSLEVGVVMPLLGFIFWLQILFSRHFSPLRFENLQHVNR